jgi:hypothetical protein
VGILDSSLAFTVRSFEKFRQAGLLALEPLVDKLPIGADITKTALFGLQTGFETMVPVISSSLDEVFFFTSALANLRTIFPTFGNTAINVLKAVGSGFLGLGGIVGSVITGITGAIKGMGALFLASGPWGWTIAAVAALGTAMYVAYKQSKWFRDLVDDLASAAKKLVLSIPGVKKFLGYFGFDQSTEKSVQQAQRGQVTESRVNRSRSVGQPVAAPGATGPDIAGDTRNFIPVAQGGEGTGALQQTIQSQEDAKKIGNEDFKNLALVFSAVGQEIVMAIKESGNLSRTQIDLGPEGRRIFKASKQQGNRVAANGHTR